MGLHLKKGQIAMEFMIMFGFAAFLLILFLSITLSRTIDFNAQRQSSLIKDLVFGTQKEINLAFESRDGYYHELKLPETLLGIDYSITISDNLLIINSTKEQIDVIVPKPQGNIKKGLNIIKKEGGIVYINP